MTAVLEIQPREVSPQLLEGLSNSELRRLHGFLHGLWSGKLEKGGPGSGNFGHTGRLGQRGGSAPRGEGGGAEPGPRDLKIRARADARPIPSLQERFPLGTTVYDPNGRALGNVSGYHENGDVKVKHGVYGEQTISDSSFVRSRAQRLELFDLQKKVAEGLDNVAREGRKDSDYIKEKDVIKAKQEVAKILAEGTGLSPEHATEVIGAWAKSSNDSNYTMLKMHEAAERVLGAEMSAFQKYRLNAVLEDRSNQLKKLPEENLIADSLRAPFQDGRGRDQAASIDDRMEEVVRAQYEATQDWFKKAGIEEVTLYRGVSLPEREVGHLKDGDRIEDLKMNALESWSYDFGTAKKFSGASSEDRGLVLAVRVPVSRIFSTARTGMGCLNEQEFVVHNNGKTPALVVRSIKVGEE